MFIVFSELPGWVQQVAAVFPLKWMTQGMRSVFLLDAAAAVEPAGNREHGRTTLVLAAWVLAAPSSVCARSGWRRDDR